MKRVRIDSGLDIEHEGMRWNVDAAEWQAPDGHGELRISKVRGDVTSPLLMTALQAEADARGLREARFVI